MPRLPRCTYRLPKIGPQGHLRSRVAAEQMLLWYAETEVPGVAMCAANTDGPYDWQLTPHGSFATAALGKMPFTLSGVAAEPACRCARRAHPCGVSDGRVAALRAGVRVGSEDP